MSAPNQIPDEALDNHLAILGKTGAGKTVTAKGAIERLLDAGERVCIIDPTGVWWGLRLMADGKTPGYPVAIFGGSRADMEITPEVALPLARLIGKSNLPAIIDTSLMTVGARVKFFAEFAEALYRENESPLHLVIDEAHLFAPQQVEKNPMSSRMLHAANNLVSGGRSRGFRIMLLSQRAAKLHKDSLTQVETLVAMRLIAPQDRKAVDAWIGEWAEKDEGAKIIASLPSLPRGEGWVWSPEIGMLERMKFPLMKTFDSSSAPKRGEIRIKPKTLADVDLSAVRAALALPDEKMVAAKAKPKDWQAETDRLVSAGRAEGYEAGFKAGYAEGTTDGLRRGVDALHELLGTAPKAAEAKPVAPATPRQAAKTPAPVAPLTGLTGPQSKVIEALGFWRSLGFDAPTRPQIAAAAGYSPSSGGFNNLLGGLRSAGLIDYPSGGVVSLTAEGTSHVPPAASGSVRDRLGAVLSAPQAKILDALMDGREKTREHLGTATGYSPTSGGFNNLLGSLRTLGIVTYPSKGCVQIEPWVLMEIA